jgi:Putative beta-barrel porin-2, OmpL-like. bbp2
MKKTFLLIFSILVIQNIQAQDSTKNNKGSFTFSGYIDSYYVGNFNNPTSRFNTGNSGVARIFDQRAGQFSLGLVQTKMNYSVGNSDVVVDLVWGPNADLGNYGNLISPLTLGGTATSGTALAIKQAYFNYKASDKLTITAGQFGTHIGYEVIDAPVNYHYSLSNLFGNGPFYHIGVKGTYAFSDKASLMLGLVNNVDNLNDNNRSKGLISQLFFSPVSGWNVYLNYITSNEANPDANGKSVDGSYNLIDLTTSYQITPSFLMGLNAAYGGQKGDYQGSGGPTETKNWGGVALYTVYNMSSNFSMGARYEAFDNTSGVRLLRDKDGNGTDVRSLTITGTWTLADGHLLVKPEFRTDAFKDMQFTDGDGKATKSQSTLSMAMIYKF